MIIYLSCSYKVKDFYKFFYINQIQVMSFSEIRKFLIKMQSDKDLKKGDIINRQNIWARRPGNGEIPAFEFEKVLGKTLKRDIAKNIQIKWSDLE